MTDAYKNIKYSLEDSQEVDEVDTAGYFGTNHRLIEKFGQIMKPLSDVNVLLRLMSKDNQIVKIIQTIRTIDHDKNGFVTNQELEDILKLCYKKELGKYNLKPMLKEFASQ